MGFCLCCFSWLRWVAKWSFIFAVLVFCIQFWLERKSYVFSDQAVATIARKYKGQDIKDSYKKLAKEFSHGYPGHILPEKDLQWIWINAGGWMGTTCVLHASLTEYVMIFGTVVDTTGHSGRYWANISDTLLTGSFRQWKEGELTSQLFHPGETVFHPWGAATSVSWTGGTWMVEYGRGFLPSTLGFALSDTIFSTHDFMSIYYLLRIYTKAMMQEFGLHLVDLKDYVKSVL